jgi:NADH:ubiquinone oxidoreductase subunit E
LGQLLAAVPPERNQLLPALHLTQELFGYIPDRAVELVAAHVRMTVNEVEGVATAYPELHRHPLGRRVIRVCTGLGCWTAGAERIVAALENACGVRLGQTSDDGALTLEATPCCFVCGVAPVVEIDGVLHGRVTPESAPAFAAAPAAVTGGG